MAIRDRARALGGVAVLAWLAWGLPVGLAAETTVAPNPPASLPTTSGTTSGHAAPLPPSLDHLLLRNGQELRGILSNASLGLRTFYAPLVFEVRALASLHASTNVFGLVEVVTVNSNRLTGFLDESTLSFRPETGDPTGLVRDSIARITFGPRAGARTAELASTWVRLRNGDLLSGKVTPDPLTLVISNVENRVSLRTVECLALASGEQTTGVAARTGTVLNAALAVERLTIALDDGPTIEIDRAAVERIGNSRLAVRNAPVSGPGPAETPVAASPIPGTGGTNLPGFVWIPAGEFTMGSPYNETGRDLDEGPQTRVVITHGFWIGQHEVTQAEYEKVTGVNPSNSTSDPQLPVEKVSWFEAVEYCARLNRLAESGGWLPTGYRFRLPTEAEWEYCCRSGTTARFCCGDDKNGSELGQYAWYSRNSDVTTHPVGLKKPNTWGLYDMHGNVWEWCLDRWEGALPGGTWTNSPATTQSGIRVARGGSWLYDAKACRSANRDDYGPANHCSDIGFRVVLAPH